jgi:predicted RNase H-like nuclease (RuvC/YqgF family)
MPEIFKKYRTLIVGGLVALVSITGMSLKDFLNSKIQDSNIKSIGYESISNAVRVSTENKNDIKELKKKISDLESKNLKLSTQNESYIKEMNDFKKSLTDNVEKIDKFYIQFNNYLIAVSKP